MKTTTATKHFTSPLYLESGRILEPYDISYETYGELNEDKSNVIVICHALTGSHHVAGYYEEDKKPGWWDSLVGDGKCIDTGKYFVICSNVIGSCFGSTGPMSAKYPSSELYRLRFPVITISDMVKAQISLFDSLGIYEVYAIIGGSMGGMQSLCYAVEYPHFTKRNIIIAATYATQPWAIAFNKIAREAIIKDPNFNGGMYDIDNIKENGLDGLAIGRMSGHISYLSENSMQNKFGRNYVETEGLYELFGRFQVERYLDYNGYNFSKWFDPLSYLYITKAINIFDASRNYDSLEDSFSHIEGSLTLLSIKSDNLFFKEEMEAIKESMKKIGKKNLVKYKCIDSNYGHDAFLVESEKFAPYIKEALQ